MKSTRRAISYAFLLLAVLVAVQAVKVANLTPRPHLIRRAPRKLPLHVSGVSERRFLVEFDAPPAVRTAPAASGFAAMERSGASVDAAAAEVGSEDEAVAQHQEFKGFLAQSTLDVSVDRTFATLFNGAAVTVSSAADVEKLTAAPMVKAVYPVVHYRQAPIEVSAAQAKMAQPMMRYAQNMTGVVMARQNLGVTGKGIKIGIIDTGLDWTHPAFAVPGKKCDKWLGPGCRAVGGKDMVGDAYDSGKKGQDVPKPGDSPMDCAGHGTHVAGIAAGFVANEFSGVAPDAQLYPYRVFGCEGSTSNEIILAALEAAHHDNLDILNLSLGGSAAFSDAPDARAVDKLSKLGIVVVSALGNDGDKGLFQASSPGIASKGFGVASFDNAMLTINLATVTGVPGLDKVGVNMDTELENEWPKGQTFTVKASPNAPTSANDGCEPFPAGYFAGKAALIRRGTCNFADKANNALKAGATAVLVYNNLPGEIEGVSLAQPKFPLNLGFINADAGAAMWNAASGGGAVSFAFNGNYQSVVNPTSGMPSDFSSWGLGANLEQKPDIGAPGGAIYSAWTSRRGKLWNTISGTSMATPFQAGVVALYLEKTKARRSPTLFDKILLGAQNTAHPAKYGDDSTMWPVAKQGAGLVDAYALLTNTVAATPSHIEFGDNPKGTRKTARITLRNNGNAPVTYTITHRQARSVLGEYGAPQSDITFSSVGARVTIEPAQVTVDVNSQVMITVTATSQEMPSPGHWLLSGYLSFKPVADGKAPHVDEAAEDEESLMARRQKNPSAPAALSVPYSMMHGDYSTYPQLSTPSLGLPWLSTAPLGFWDFHTESPELPVWTKPEETTPAFTLKGLDMPVMLYQVTLVTRLAACAVLDAKTGAKIGYLNAIGQAVLGSMFWPYTNQTDPETGKPVYGWNGEYYKTVEAASSIAGKVYQIPDGEYIWQLELTPPSVQHITKDFEKVLRPVWKSPKIVIKRGGATTSTTTSSSTTSTTATSTTSTTAAVTSSTATTISGTTKATSATTGSTTATTGTSTATTGSTPATTGASTAPTSAGTSSTTGSATSTAASTSSAASTGTTTASGTVTAPNQTTGSASSTAAGFVSSTAAGTASSTGSGSVTATGSASSTATGSASATQTATGSASSTAAGSQTGTASQTATGSQAATTGSGSATATATATSGSGSATATGTVSGSATITGTAGATTTSATGTATATTTQQPGTTVIPCPPCPGGTKTVIIIQPTATVTTTVAPCPVCPGGTKTIIIVPPTQTVTQTVTPQPTMTTVPCGKCPGGIKTVIIIPPVGTQTDVCTIEPTHTVVPCKDTNTCPNGSTTQVVVQPTIPASPTTAGPAPTVTTEPCGKCPGGVKTIIIVPPTGTQTAPATVTPTHTVVPCNECNGGVKTVIVVPPPAQPTVPIATTVVDTPVKTTDMPSIPAQTTPIDVPSTPAKTTPVAPVPVATTTVDVPSSPAETTPAPIATQPASDSYGQLEVPEEPAADKPKKCHRKCHPKPITTKTKKVHYTMA